jgi:site-specific DNA-methyltransferase (adenine-specific)
MELINGDCLIELKKLKDKSIDFVYLDLPYGQTACKWDKKLDHIALWEELKRIAKNDRTPFFFSCTTKFGFELYNTAPKGWFRWDLVWEKNRAAGFLNAYRLPTRKHEMVYCFAQKSPEYDVSSHLTGEEVEKPPSINNKYLMNASSYHECYDKPHKGKVLSEPLPTSVLPLQEDHELVYCFAKKTPEYDVSSHLTGEEKDKKNDCKWLNETGGKRNSFNKLIVKGKVVKDPLPTSILPPQEDHELVYCFAKKSPDYDVSSHLTGEEVVKPPCKDCIYTMETSTGGKNCFYKPFKSKVLNDPLPTSVLPPQEDHELVYCFAQKSPEYDVSSHLTGEEVVKPPSINNKYLTEFQNRGSIPTYEKPHKSKVLKEPLPTSVLPPQEDHELVYCFAQKTPEYDVSSHLTGEEVEKKPSESNKFLKEGGYVRECHKSPHKSKVLKEPLPTSVLDIPSSWCKYKLDEGINHRTSKPVKLMEFLLKYWSKEGDTILDPTAGSGSMGCACINMNRKFIGIEKDPDIFAIMKDRLDKHKKGEKVIKPKKKTKKK